MKYPVLFVSLGSGDPELITLKSLHALQHSDVIFCPFVKRKTGKAESRAVEMLRELGISHGIEPFYLPMSKDRTAAMQVYRQVADDIHKAYEKGKQVAVVVEGDAGIYASIHYVLDALYNCGVQVSQLPGIPSFIASGALARLHLVSQEERLVIVPGNVTAAELNGYLQSCHVVVIMKLSQCAEIVQHYIRLHSEYEYHYFENVSTKKEFYTCSIEDMLEKDYPYFSLMIVRSRYS